MARVKEQTQSMEALERQQTQLLGAREAIEERIRSGKGEVDLAVARDAELSKLSRTGQDTTKERDRLSEEIGRKKDRLGRAVTDLAGLMEDLEDLDQKIVKAKYQADVDRVAASAERRRVGILALGQEIPVALSAAMNRLEELMAEWEEERQTRNKLTKSFEAPGERSLLALRNLVGELVRGAQAIGRGTP